MLKNTEFINAVQGMVNKGLEKNIVHLYTDNEEMRPGQLWLNGLEINNFGSCSYLGMEFDPRLKQGAIEGIQNFGTQFSSSRAYVSTGQYGLLEEKFRTIFNAHPVLAPTTSLGHIATLPTVVEDNDLVLLDHQVHSSVQTAAKLLKARGIEVELIRHNRPDVIEEKLIAAKTRYNKVWYLADGIYSMYGDGAPVEKLLDLMNRYDQFYCYIDDAHGMSCYGPKGSGYILQHGPLHPKMILAVSFAKAFATGGSAIVFPNAEWAHTVRSCGGPLITSGPLQPATLGAANAMADIHLTDEIYTLQEDLADKIKFTEFLLKKANLPLIKDNPSPVFFIGTSAPDTAFNVVGNMMKDGFYLNVSAFPVVPMKNAGIRFTITRNNDFSQIEAMVTALTENYFNAIIEDGLKLSKIYTAFKKEMPANINELEQHLESFKNQNTGELTIEHTNSVAGLDENAWNKAFVGRGNYTTGALKQLEMAFTGNTLPQDNWDFDYLTVKDQNGQLVAATFFTTALMKDDMLSSADQSEFIESIRQNGDPYYMCSRVTMMGSLITEGEHLFVSENHPSAKEAIELIFIKAEQIQKSRNGQSLMLRDFEKNNEMAGMMGQKFDFLQKELPVNYSISLSGWNDLDGYLASIGKKSRKHVRDNVIPELAKYDVICDKGLMDPAKWHELYLNVQKRGRELNTFPLTLKFFEKMHAMPNWDVVELWDKETGNVACAVFSFAEGNQYNTLLIGQDYNYGAYRPGLLAAILRGNAMGCENILLGYSCDMEKLRLGAKGKVKCAYIQTSDTFAYEYISMVSSNKK